jgi:hypothetical protein
MEESNMTVEELLWKRMESKMDALVTRRLLAFHDALVERGQIPSATRIAPPIPGGEEIVAGSTNRCREESAA